MRAAVACVVALAGLFLALCPCAFASDPSLDISQYAHTSWKIRDGFTKGTINAIAQTPDGYLWLGTEFGLLRFDGVRATPWQPPNGQQLPDNYVRNLLVARDGTLWISTIAGLASWKDGKFTIVPDLSGQFLGDLLEDREGTLWVGTNAATPTAKLCAVRIGNVQCYGGDGSLGSGVVGLYEDEKGNLWVGVTNGFWRWKPGAREFFSLLASNIIQSFATDDQGALLIGGAPGIKRLVNGHIEAYPGWSQPIAAMRMLRARDGSLWIGTLDRGLIHIHQGRVDEFSQAEGLSGGTVSSLFEDREGNIWVATSDGLNRFRAYAVSTISVKQGLTNSVAWSVLAAKDGSVWISAEGDLNRWERGRLSIVGRRKGAGGRLNRLASHSLFEDNNGRVWVSTFREFGYIEDDQFRAIRGYPEGVVHGVAELASGHFWLAHQQAGLLQVFQGKVVQQIPWTGLGHKDPAMALLADPAHKGLWLGFYGGGVAYFSDGGIQKSYSSADGLGSGSINQLRFGPSGTLWAATEGGLSRIKDGHISTLTAKNGLPCDSVHWSMDDADHAVWLYMPCGLVRIDRSELDAWAAEPTRIVKTSIFDASDGVRVRSKALLVSPPVTRTPDGKIWFVSGDGVSVVDPVHLPVNKLPPPVHIEQVTADRQSYEVTAHATGNVRLPPLIRDLQIDYTALSLVAPEKVLFRYKLEGWDRDWQDVGNRRQAFYSNLPPRNYRFRVMASNNSGVWNEDGAALQFSVAPAYYQAWWFRSLCVVFFLAAVAGIYRLRVRQLAGQFNLRLEERVNERTRIARDLHDTLLQSFQGLMLRFRVLAFLLPDRPGEARKVLEEVIEQARSAITEGRDAVHGLRSSVVLTNELAQAISNLGEQLNSEPAGRQSASFRVDVQGPTRELVPLLRDDVYRIAGEALRNAFRHAHPRHIEVEIRYDPREFRLRVRDDGKGIDAGVLAGAGQPGHYGLPGMHERAKLIGGKLEVWSELGSGTEIELTLPASLAYAESPQKRRTMFWRRGA